jgi:hypothetical protein
MSHRSVNQNRDSKNNPGKTKRRKSRALQGKSLSLNRNGNFKKSYLEVSLKKIFR